MNGNGAMPIDQIKRAAADAGFKGDALNTATAIALAESSGIPQKINHQEPRGPSYGLWQIHSSDHPQFDTQQLVQDPNYNAQAAFQVSQGGKVFHPWTTFKTGAFAKYLKDARAAQPSVSAAPSDAPSSALASAPSAPQSLDIASTRTPQTLIPSGAGLPADVSSAALEGRLPSFTAPTAPTWQSPTPSLDPVGPLRWYQKLGQGFQQGWGYQPGVTPPPGVTMDQWGQTAPSTPAVSKLGKLFAILHGAAMGAAAGSTQLGFGSGMMAAQKYGEEQQQKAMELASARQNLAYLPLQRWWQMQQLQAEIKQKQAQADLATAQAGGVSHRTALEDTQAEAANFKEDPIQGLIDIRTGKPVAGDIGMAALDGPTAAVLGKQPGDRVPLPTALKAKQFVNAGMNQQREGEFIRIEQKLASGQPLTPEEDSFDKAYRNMKTVNLSAANPLAGATPAPVGATGEGSLQGLSRPQQTLVRTIASYDADLKHFRSTRNVAAAAELLDRVKQYNPNWSEGQYDIRQGVRKSFTSGPDAKTMASLNMVAHHLDQLDKANDALNSGNVEALNRIAHTYQVNVEGKSQPAIFDAVKAAVSGELGTTFKGTPATDPEIATIAATLSRDLAKKVNKDVIAADVGLIEGRLKALQFKYEEGTKNPADFEVISPEAQQIFNRLGGGIKVTDPLGGVHTFPDQAAADAFKKSAHIQ